MDLFFYEPPIFETPTDHCSPQLRYLQQKNVNYSSEMIGKHGNQRQESKRLTRDVFNKNANTTYQYILIHKESAHEYTRSYTFTSMFFATIIIYYNNN